MASVNSQITIDVRAGDHLLIDGRRIMVELMEKSGKLARLRITAPLDVKIERDESDQPRAMREKMLG